MWNGKKSSTRGRMASKSKAGGIGDGKGNRSKGKGNSRRNLGIEWQKGISKKMATKAQKYQEEWIDQRDSEGDGMAIKDQRMVGEVELQRE